MVYRLLNNIFITIYKYIYDEYINLGFLEIIVDTAGVVRNVPHALQTSLYILLVLFLPRKLRADLVERVV